ncbi:MAG: hypothetical protein IT380_17650 [Myxococcales bacterium]|nr:hypothetical protein [Myxococcales bacterium]
MLGFALAIALSSGCSRPAEPPVLTGIAPDRGPADRPVAVVITGERLRPHLFTDFSKKSGSALRGAWSARLGRVPLEQVALAEDGLHAVVPAGLTPGLYTLFVVTPAGRDLSLADAFRVVSADNLDALVSAYRVEAIAPQRVGVPFDVTVTARDELGQVVDGFAGVAALADRTGTVVPRAVGPFHSGVWTGRVEVRAPSAADALSVSDAAGRSGASNDFAVGPGSGAALRFQTPPRTTVAGQCSQAVSVEVVDATGAPVLLPSALALALTATPPTGLSLFSDAACTAALTSPTLATGSGTATLFLKATRAGPVRLNASAAGLVGASQVQTVTPGPPTSLGFVTPSPTVTAGACSNPVTLAVRDAFGNDAPGSAPRTVALSASPSAGFTFFDGPGCGAAATQVTVPGGAARVHLSLQGTAAGLVTVTASTAGLPDATQQVRITPEGFPSRVVIVSAPQTLEVALCSGPLAAQTQDSLGNAVSSPTPVTLNVDSAPAGALAYFADSTCTTPATQVLVGAGTSTALVYFRGQQPGAITAQVSSTGLMGDSQVQTILPGPATQLAFATPPRSAPAGGCSADVLVEVRDAAGFSTTVTAPTTLSLAANPAAGFTLYDDAACTSAVTQVMLAAGTGAARLYYRGTAVGVVTVDAQAPGLTPAQQVEVVTAGPPAQLVFVTPPQTVGAGACSAVATVEARDAFGNPAPGAGARTLALSAAPPAGVTFFSDPGCTTAAGSVALPAGAPQASFFFRATPVGTLALTAASAGLTPAQQQATVVAGAVAALAFTTTAQTRTAGACSAVGTVDVRDALGNASPVASATVVGLSAAPATGFTFYSDAGCTTAITGVSVPMGGATASFYFRGTVAGPVAVTASSAGLLSAQQTHTISPATAAALVFTTPARSVTAGGCSANLDVQVRDTFGNPVPQGAARAVNLSAAPAAGFTFYSDAACGSATTSVAVGAGASSAAFYVRGTGAGSVTVTAQSTGVTGATQSVAVTAAATPSKLAFTTPPRTVVAGQCSAVLSVQSRDSFDNPRAVASNTAVNLGAVPAAGVTFFSDAACATPATSVTLLAGTNTVSFYVRGGTAGAPQATATAAGLNPASQAVTVNAAPPARLAFVTPARTVAAGGCTAILTVESRDPLGNASAPGSATTITLTSGAGVTFYSDAACGTAVAQVTLGAAATQQSFYVRGTLAGSPTLTATAAGLTPATQGLTVTAGAPAKLAFTNAPLSAVAGGCSAVATVQVRDTFDNAVTLASPLPVNLSTTGVAVTLYAGACATAVTQVTVPMGGSTASFTFRGTAAGGATVTATATGLTPASQVETVTPAAPNTLVFTTAPQALAAGTCSAMATVQARDAFGNASPVSAATTVNLSATPATGFGFFTAAGCGTATASVTLGAGASQVNVFFRGTSSGVVQATAAATGFTSANQNETINPGAATSFAWDPVASPRTLGVPFSVTVRARDAFGNTATSFVGTATLTISPVATTVTCVAPCTSASVTDVFTAGVWTGTVSLGGSSGAARVLTATQGAVTGSSGAFDVASANRTPPIARFAVTPRVVTTGQNVTFDASSSSDLQTPTAALQVSWDFTGVAAGPPPWSAWTTTKTATNSFAAAGLKTVRLAVRDADGDIGYATGWVQVLSNATNLCVVDTSSNTDDGASSCSSKGLDGRLSLREAVRLSNSMAGTQTISFDMARTITGSGFSFLDFTSSSDVIAPSGVQVVGWVPRVTQSGAAVRWFGLELSGQNRDITVAAGATLEVWDSYLHNLDGIVNDGTLVLDKVTMANCTNTSCLEARGPTTVRYSHLRAATNGIQVTGCSAGAAWLTVFGTVFTGLQWGINGNCPSSFNLRNNSFDGNGVGIDFSSPGGTGHVLVNNVFTNHTTAAVTDCPNAAFTTRSHHLFFGNAANEASSGGAWGACCCNLGGDPNVLTVNPLYALPASFDYRLTFGSPAIDTALDLGLPLLPGAPGNFLGAGPDYGGRESY